MLTGWLETRLRSTSTQRTRSSRTFSHLSHPGAVVIVERVLVVAGEVVGVVAVVDVFVGVVVVDEFVGVVDAVVSVVVGIVVDEFLRVIADVTMDVVDSVDALVDVIVMVDAFVGVVGVVASVDALVGVVVVVAVVVGVSVVVDVVVVVGCVKQYGMHCSVRLSTVDVVSVEVVTFSSKLKAGTADVQGVTKAKRRKRTKRIVFLTTNSDRMRCNRTHL